MAWKAGSRHDIAPVSRALVASLPALRVQAAGAGVEGLSLHSYTGECPPGVVLGHGYMAEPAIERGIELLREAARM